MIINLKDFCEVNGSMELHRSWRDNMLEQDREVTESRMVYKTLAEQDKVLDAKISFDVITDFLVYCQGHSINPLDYLK